MSDSNIAPEASQRITSHEEWAELYQCQSLQPYVRACVERYWELQKHKEKSPLYWFVWLVKGHDEMTQFMQHPQEAFKVVEDHLQELSNDIDPWQEFFDKSAEEAGFVFTQIWSQIRYRVGWKPLEQAFAANDQHRLLLPDDIKKRYPKSRNKRSTHDYEFFIGMCAHLQVIMGVRRICPVVQDVARLMAVDEDTVSRYRQAAIRDGFLREVRRANYRRHLAAEFYFCHPEMWESLKAQITTGECDVGFGEMEWQEITDVIWPPVDDDGDDE